MKKAAILSASALLVVLALGLIVRAAAQGEGMRHPRMAGPGHEAKRLLALLDSDRAKAMLGLTDDQAARLRQITVETEKTTIKTKADLAVRGIELRELLQADNPNQDVVMKKVQEVSDLTGQLMRQHVQALLSAKTVLTPEQQKKIREFMANQRFGRPGMRGQGMRGPGFGMQGGQGRPGMPPRPPNPPPAQPMEPPVQ